MTPRSASRWWPVLAVLAGALLAPLASPAQTQDPAKVAELRKQFTKGQALMDEGKMLEALDVFDAILEQEPKARGSLVMAAVINMNLARFSKAIELLNRFRALEPNDPNGLTMLIPAYQALNDTAKANEIVAQLKQLHASGTVPALSQEDYFLRERIQRPDGSQIEILEAYDFRQPPFHRLFARELNPQGRTKRQVFLLYDPEASRKVAAMDSKLRNAQVFFLTEDVRNAQGDLTAVNVYRQVFAPPPYEKARDWMTSAILMAPKPIAQRTVKDGKVVFPAPTLSR
ncbi:MAG: tetratricopeptide repeat protein [Verrucomicrobiota bacterium]